MELLVNIDVPDLKRAEEFYTRAFGLKVTRRFGDGGVELSGLAAKLYLLVKLEGSEGAAGQKRSYARHWTPVHLDIAVDDIEAALKRALDAGAVQETEIRRGEWGAIAVLADPFGHGLCLIQFTAAGYDAVSERVG
ncbi:MAG: VOC family protein [Reyranellaceae bacterium]